MVIHENHKYEVLHHQELGWYFSHLRYKCCSRMLHLRPFLDRVEDLYNEGGICAISLEEFAVKLGLAEFIID